MKALKETLSRLANRKDDCTGAFWEGRFRSLPLLDTAAIANFMVYNDRSDLHTIGGNTCNKSVYISKGAHCLKNIRAKKQGKKNRHPS